MKIRVSAPEKQSFERAAEISGLALSAWARRILRTAAIKELENIGEKAVFLTPAPNTKKDEKGE